MDPGYRALGRFASGQIGVGRGFGKEMCGDAEDGEVAQFLIGVVDLRCGSRGASFLGVPRND
jgi:hypothetical protein